MLEIGNVTKRFGDTVILENASYAFPGHGLVCLLGPSGSGKSTLLNLIAGFDSGYEGTIRSCGQTLDSLDGDGLAAYRRDCVGFVFQNYHLLPGRSVLENVLTPTELTGGTPEEHTAKARALLSRLGMEGKEEQSVETLSGGQKQRAAIARALMGDPQLILADEPTGALDRTTSNEIMELLRELSADRLVVVITHDPKVCQFADEVLHIENRVLVAERTAADRAEAPVADHVPDPVKPSPKKRAGRNFKIHMSRYVAAALAISIGLLAFLFSLSFANVMDREIEGFKEKNTVFNNGYIRGVDDGTVLNFLQGDGRIEHVYYQYPLYDLTLTMNGQSEALAEKLPLPKTGEALSYGVMPRRGADEIAITPSLAKKFAANIQELLGQTLTLTVNGGSYDLTVCGIYNAGYDDFFVSSDVEQALYEGLSEQDNYSISYDIDSFEHVVAVSNALELRGIHSQNAAAEVFAMQESFRSLNQLFQIISILVLALALFLCAVLLFKLQNSRYREMGLLSALGFRAGYLRSMVRWENLYLSAFSAGVSGVLLVVATAVCRLVNFPLAMGATQIVLCLGGAFVVIILISSLASAKLIRTEPAAALKHD